MSLILGQYIYALVEERESGMCRAGETNAAVLAFLRGLDANDKDRLKAAALAAYDEYVELNSYLKKFGRSTVEKTIDNFINDWTT